jgi:hypothetical protein
MDAQIGKFGGAMLLLGRLDGRLHSSLCADIFLARSRLEGAAALARLGGVPVDVRDLQDWITGRSPPPRASEGLDDPISIAALFHFSLIRDENSRDPVLRATLHVLRTILDDRSEAETYGREDLAYFGPIWRKIRETADLPFDHADLFAIAKRVFDLIALTQSVQAVGLEIRTFDGRSLEIPPGARNHIWLIAAVLPRMLYRAGLTTRHWSSCRSSYPPPLKLSLNSSPSHCMPQ